MYQQQPPYGQPQYGHPQYAQQQPPQQPGQPAYAHTAYGQPQQTGGHQGYDVSNAGFVDPYLSEADDTKFDHHYSSQKYDKPPTASMSHIPSKGDLGSTAEEKPKYQVRERKM